MKKRMIGWMMVLTLALSGCGAAETFETVSDVYGSAPPAQHRAVLLELPEEAASPVAEGEHGQLYLCGDYEITLQTMAAGDLARTVETVSGYDKDELTVIQTQTDGVVRYDFVWTAVGEGSQQILRASVLDDGNYHYVLTAQTDAENAGDLRAVWDQIFASFALDQY